MVLTSVVMEEFVGPHCKELGINRKALDDALADNRNLSALCRRDKLSNGIVFELMDYKRSQNLSLDSIIQLVAAVDGVEQETVNVKGAGAKIVRIKSQRSKLQKDKCNQQQVQEFLVQHFDIPLCKEVGLAVGNTEHASVGHTDQSTFEDNVEKVLAKEACDLEHELKTVQESNAQLQESVQSLYSRLRNLRKVVGRRGKKIDEMEEHEATLQKTIEHLDLEMESMVSELEKKSVKAEETQRKLKNEYERTYYHRKERLSSDEMLKSYASTATESASAVKYCEARIAELEACLHDALCQLEGKARLQTKHDGVFIDSVRMCCLKLLSQNVGILNVRPVIETVLEMVGMHAEQLPSTGTLSNMLIELKRISSMHAASELLASDNLTLYSDGTSKFGDKYGTYLLANECKTFSMGLVDMKCGTAAHTLEKLQEVLCDVTDVCEALGESKAGDRILSKLKNTMSDRCAVQKSFNDLLQDYRADILPGITEGWNDMSESAKDNMAKVNRFFCGMHFIVGLATQAVKTLSE